LYQVQDDEKNTLKEFCTRFYEFFTRDQIKSHKTGKPIGISNSHSDSSIILEDTADLPIESIYELLGLEIEKVPLILQNLSSMFHTQFLKQMKKHQQSLFQSKILIKSREGKLLHNLQHYNDIYRNSIKDLDDPINTFSRVYNKTINQMKQDLLSFMNDRKDEAQQIASDLLKNIIFQYTLESEFQTPTESNTITPENYVPSGNDKFEEAVEIYKSVLLNENSFLNKKIVQTKNLHSSLSEYNLMHNWDKAVKENGKEIMNRFPMSVFEKNAKEFDSISQILEEYEKVFERIHNKNELNVEMEGKKERSTLNLVNKERKEKLRKKVKEYDVMYEEYCKFIEKKQSRGRMNEKPESKSNQYLDNDKTLHEEKASFIQYVLTGSYAYFPHKYAIELIHFGIKHNIPAGI
jgi:hypothetical protein